MNFSELEAILSKNRLARYLKSSNGDESKAILLYQKNVVLSKEFFAVINYFEIALRNKIDECYTHQFGQDWIKRSIEPAGFFNGQSTQRSAVVIRDKIQILGNNYHHLNLLTLMDFGFWRYLFAAPQFFAAGAILLSIFPNKPRSNKKINYNHKVVFNYLSAINGIRNRIAHHEPLCFQKGENPNIDTYIIRLRYAMINKLFEWMNINAKELLMEVENVIQICDEIDILKQ